ncbi:MAG: GDP-mannose 4,6-dehydratase [Alphaproteobacteria bacterium]
MLCRCEQVVGIENLIDYYVVRMKEARLERLRGRNGFAFHKIDISDTGQLGELADETPRISRVVHLAAQAGVRYSLTNPFAYVQANLVGHMAILEMCRHLPDFEHLVYASSSSVYGGNTKLPFATEDRTDTPVSLYAATKKADELMSHCYAHLYRIPQTGLRFFTVYGPWGRPDMAMYIFCKAITAGKPIPVFNYGDMMRDFTFIDDIVVGVIAALDNPPVDGGEGKPPQRIYNIGNNKSEPLMRMIGLIEDALGKKAEIDFQPMQPGDVKESFADIDAISRDLGFKPTTRIDVGVPKFVDWFKRYEGV